MIYEPGFYEISAKEYHADPCEIPSLSSTIAKMLVHRSPRHAWSAHPRLGGAKDDGDDAPDPSTSKAKALGELVHRLVLGKGGDIAVIDEDSFRSNAAKAVRDNALALGQIPVLAHKLPEAEEVAKQVRIQLDAMGYDYVYRDGRKEVVLVWEENDIWLRAMLDNLHIDESAKMAEIRDLKTVGRSSHPEACSKQISDMGYDLSLAFYKRGLIALRPELAGRIKCGWDFVEVNAPYAVTPVELNGEWELMADMACERAVALWRKCMTEKKWPFYVSGMVKLEPKPWLMAKELGESLS